MEDSTKTALRPKITVVDVDYDKLVALADAAIDRMPDEAEALRAELERAKVVSAAAAPAGLVRMGSTATFSFDDGQETRATLVFPEEADFANGKLSVLTPVGAALIGLSAGQSIDWKRRDGSVGRLTVTAVENA